MALRGTMWHYSCIKQKLKYIVFFINVVFLHCGTMWRYVALFLYKAKIELHCVLNKFCFFCGTMWHYVALFLYKAKIEIHCVFDKFCFLLWHYVALCGTIPV